MKKKLFVVEASGKIKKITSLLSECIDDDFEVVATNGKLFDLPNDKLGIDPETLRIKSMEPISPEKINFLEKKIASASHVYIMSDNDIEGEVIAKEISTLIPAEVSRSRILLNALTIDSMSEALRRQDQVNESIVSCGVSRRIFDRLVGFSLSSFEHNHETVVVPGVIGRVLTPVLHELGSAPYEVAVLQKTIPDPMGGEWQLDISISNDALKLGQNTRDLLASLEDMEVIETSRVTLPDDTVLWSGIDTLLNVCNTLNIEPDEAMRCMEELYEEGDISYPRSDSRQLSHASILELQKISEIHGILDFSVDKIKKNNINPPDRIIQGAHEAVVPLSHRIDINSNIDSLTIKDRILLIITKNAITAGRENLNKTIINGALSNNLSKNDEWFKLISRFNKDSVTIKKIYTETTGFKRKSYINSSFNNGTDTLCSKRNPSIKYKEHSKGLVVLMSLDRIGIGRPSTVSRHAKKIAKKFIRDNMQLNKRAELSVRRAETLAPGFLNFETCRRIDAILHTASESSTTEKILLSLKEGGIPLIPGESKGTHMPSKSKDNDRDISLF